MSSTFRDHPGVTNAGRTQCGGEPAFGTRHASPTWPLRSVRFGVALLVFAGISACGADSSLEPKTVGAGQGSIAPVTTALLPPPVTTTAVVPPSVVPGSADESVCDGRCRSISAALTERIQAAVSGGAFGFHVEQVGGPVIADLNEGAPFYPASAIKTVHLLHAMRWATGRLDETMGTQVPVYADSCSGSGASSPRPLGQLLREMMIDSNNQSTNALQDFFGVGQLSETMASAGMINSAIHHKFGCGGPSNDPANQMTAEDLASLYGGVADGTLLADAEREHFLATMIDVVELISDSASSGSNLGEATHVYLKEGWYGNTLTLGGLVVRTGSTSATDQWVFALFIQDAITIAPDFEITDLIADLSELGAFDP